MLSHEEKKFRHWSSRVQNALEKKKHELRFSCTKLIYWSNRIKELDSSYYNERIRDMKFSLISKSIPLLFDEYYKYLHDSKRHGKFTKVRQRKIMRFVYQFNNFLIPLAEEVGDTDFLKDKIKKFLDEHSAYIFFDLSSIDGYQIDSLLALLNTAHDLGIDDTSLLRLKVESEILNRQMVEITSKDLLGESTQVEFKDKLPENIQKLAKEIAAFASTEGGRIYLGINDEGEINGVDESEISSFDKLQQRIAGITSNVIRPAISVAIEQYWVGDKMIIQVNIPKGSEPVYYVRNIPYIRDLTTSRPATPLEVKSLHLRHFINNLQNTV